jgi:plasmid maintenance system antidote protein VapI
MDLAQYLKDHDISQRQFAIKMGVYPLTICDIVRKKRSPTLEMAIRIEDETYGKVTCRELMGNKSKKEGKKKQRRQTQDGKDKLKLRVSNKASP